MAITPLPDGASVSVDTFTDLKTFLQDNGIYAAYHTAYLAADIEIAAGGISINPGRTLVTVDGTDPNDPSGQTIHTITDAASAAAADCIGVRSAPLSNMHVIFRSLTWVGKNYYGAFYTPDVAVYNAVTVTFKDVSYLGPQISYHAYGKTRFIDCAIKTAASTSAISELAEVSQVEIGGVTTIEQTSTAYPIFYFRDGNNNVFSLTILPDSDVTFIAGNDVMEGNGYHTALTVGQRAKFTSRSQSKFCRGAAARLSSVLIDRDAVFTVRQLGTGTPSLVCNGAFTVNQNAVADIRYEYNGTGRLLYFYPTAGSTASLNLNDPSDFIMYKQYDENVINFATPTNINITAQQVNFWNPSASSAIAGTMDDIPTYSWRKEDGGNAQITGSATATANTLTGNFTPEELQTLPPLSELKLYAARALSAGNLPLTVNPVSNIGMPVSGTTAVSANLLVDYSDGTAAGASDNEGEFSISTPVIAEGTPVTVKSNIPFLITTVTTASVPAGALTLLDPPEWMRFILAPIAFSPVVLYGRQDSDWTISVEDSRAESSVWYLYATVDGPMTSEDNPAHTVPGALVCVDENDVVTPLGTNPVLIYTGEGNGGSAKITEISWDTAKGILLQATPTPYFNGEEYRANISWELSDTELEE